MSLVVPATARPANLHLRPGTKAELVDGDLYDVCKRIGEVDERLFILLLDDGDAYAYAIMERCPDGWDRLVFKVKQLDGRVIERLRGLMAVPLNERLKTLEAEEHRLKEEAEQEAFEELYERLGGPMWTELERTGFSQRPISYPKRGVTNGSR